MPRPGPRPYECTRRPWHSDRHQPLRGSLIQEIFRVVNEVHSPATKKNKEWQDKLPLVVLKAEEIMYSKANSEAEYMDLKTLWERTNDAIDTIIRRDESSESGDLLQPCIEAALNVGCMPRRASRSQRHNTPRYLTPATQETDNQMSGAQKYIEIGAYDKSSGLLPPHCRVPINNSSPGLPSYYSFLLTPRNVSKIQLGLDSSNVVIVDKPVPCERSVPLMSSCEFSTPEKFPLSCKDKPLLQTDPSLRLGGSYPIYYSCKHPTAESGSTLSHQHGSNCDANRLSSTLVQPPEEADSGHLLNIIGCCNTLDTSSRHSSRNENIGSMFDGSPLECDLSLRLGPLLTPCPKADDNSVVEDAGNCSQDRSCCPTMNGMKSGHFDDSFLLPQRNQGFCFFPGESSKASWRDTQVNGVPRG